MPNDEEDEQQEVDTSTELNDKFTQGSEETGEFLNVEVNRKSYDVGLVPRIASLNDKTVLGTIFLEHLQMGKMKKPPATSITTVHDQHSDFTGEIPHPT